MINDQRQLLSIKHTPELIEKIESEFNMLRKLQLPSDKASTIVSFCSLLGALGDQFSSLRWFFGGLATVFENTATVEIAISILNYEKDDGCRKLSTLSLAGIMNSKNWNEVRKVKFYYKPSMCFETFDLLSIRFNRAQF